MSTQEYQQQIRRLEEIAANLTMAADGSGGDRVMVVVPRHLLRDGAAAAECALRELRRWLMEPERLAEIVKLRLRHEALEELRKDLEEVAVSRFRVGNDTEAQDYRTAAEKIQPAVARARHRVFGEEARLERDAARQAPKILAAVAEENNEGDVPAPDGIVETSPAVDAAAGGAS